MTHADLTAAVLIAGVTLSGFALLLAAAAITFALLALYAVWRYEHTTPRLTRSVKNPILEPDPTHYWESEAVFNPAAFYKNGRVHLLYRAMGKDGISRIGYASSKDGITFDERSPTPIFTPTRDFGIPERTRVYGPLSYDTKQYPSGGGWGGSEDPRLVEIDGNIFMSFVAFDGWGFVRMALTSILANDFAQKKWKWTSPTLISPPNEINKNWVLFPEKIKGKYALLHSISPEIRIEYVDSMETFDGSHFVQSTYTRSGRDGFWDSWVRGAGPPPIQTKLGWLLLYHAMDEREPNKYQLGAMILDKNDPTKILYRTPTALLSPETWYENDGKAGVVYTCGAVVVKGDLLIYYGGGDKRIAVAKTNLNHLLHTMKRGGEVTLAPKE